MSKAHPDRLLIAAEAFTAFVFVTLIYGWVAAWL
jgi:hypothetical protein